VLERGVLNLIFDFAIMQSPFEGDELPLLHRLTVSATAKTS
jgi:hypothetical protein